MRTDRAIQDFSSAQGGFAFIATLAVLVLLSTLVVAAYATAMADFRSGNMDLGKSRTLYAAEAGGEDAMAQLALALEDAVLDDAELDGIVPPTMPDFSFDSFNVKKVGSVEHELITDGPFAGLYALTQRVEIYSQASDLGGSSSAVLITAKAQAIPIFQFGVFYDQDLEIHNGPPMYFAGWVHSNGNIYVSSNNSYFEDLITTPKKLFHDRKAYHDVKDGVYVDDAGGNSVKLTFDSRTHSNPNAFRNASNARFDNRVRTDAYDVDSLRVPLPPGVGPVEVTRPREAGDSQLEKAAKYAWKADWYIEVPFDELEAGDGPDRLCEEMIQTREAGKNLPSAAACEAIFDIEFEAFWDGRENRWVDVIEVDLGNLFDWAKDNIGPRETQILYIYASEPGAGPDPSGDGTYPAVRLKNGFTIGNPFSFATEHPVYTQGHINAGLWQPMSIVGDALTILSTVWDDGAQQGAFRNTAANTTLNAAILMGHSGSVCDHEEPGCALTSYGGGLENFPRFLEDWNGRTLTYRGSLVSLHFARYATGDWGGAYYRPPNRDWEFDTRFDDPANLPPGTPVVGNVLHTAFQPLF